jgi:hypothetical protein
MQFMQALPPGPRDPRLPWLMSDWRAVFIPYWFIMLLCAPLTVRGAGRIVARLTRRPGCCARCGYDLRATPERCPECSTLSSNSRAL